jgi:hypothetical protein
MYLIMRHGVSLLFHFRYRPSILLLASPKWLSLVGCLLLVATNSAALNCKSGSGGPASYMGFLPLCAPDSERCQPCGQGPPLIRPDGAVVKATNEGGRDNEDVDDDDEEDDEFVHGQVGFRIRHTWVFLSCLLGPFGPLAPVVPVMGNHGRPLFFHGLFLILESSQFR